MVINQNWRKEEFCKNNVIQEEELAPTLVLLAVVEVVVEVVPVVTVKGSKIKP